MVSRRTDKILFYSIIFTIFSKELFTTLISGYQIDTFAYTLFLLYFLVNLGSIKVSKHFFSFALVLLAFSVWSILFLKLPLLPVLKQYVPIMLSLIVINDVISKGGYHPFKIFEGYLKLASLVALFGLIQWVLSYFFGLDLLIKESGALDSITYEPSHYAAVIIPASIYRTYYFKKNRVEAIILLLSLFFTFSLTTYVVLLIVFLIPRFKFIMLPYIIVVLFFFYKFVPSVNDRLAYRINGIETVLLDPSEERPYDAHGTNASIISLYTNLDVALYSLVESPLIGAGLGGHETMYFRYFRGKQFERHKWFGLNYNSAHSLLLRIVSETGLIGLVVFLNFMYRHYVPKRWLEYSTYHVISLSCIGHFICKSFKLGGYFDYGTPFFLVMLILNLSAFKLYVQRKG